MNPLKHRIKQKQHELSKNPHILFKNEDGAIDLASIMVGIIVIGLIGGVIASTVFVVIPWTQNNAAKHQLDSVSSAESAYFGLSATNPPSLPAGAKANSFGNSVELETANLLKTGETYCVSTPIDGKTYQAFSQSSSGVVWATSNANSKPEIFTGTLPSDCEFIRASATSPTPSPTGTSTPSATATPTPTIPPAPPYVDPTPSLTTLTYNCAVTTTGTIPMKTGLTGKETWNGGTPINYTNAATANNKTLTANTVYTVTFDGTYTAMDSSTSGLAACLRSVDHWGMNSGVINAQSAFQGATNLTNVPENIPASITNVTQLFYNATKINDPNISKWDVSHLTSTYRMFWNAGSFDQPLNDWDMSNVQTTWGMFYGATVFNRPLDKWDTSNFINTNQMFRDAKKFNQDINNWDVSNVTDMSGMFFRASAYNMPLDRWKTPSLTNTGAMFNGATAFNQDLIAWDMSHVTTTQQMFYGATAFNGDVSNWVTGNVTGMYQMFYGATAFNGDVTGWNTVKVTDMRGMFFDATVFNRDLRLWNTAALTAPNGTQFARASFNTLYLPNKTSL